MSNSKEIYSNESFAISYASNIESNAYNGFYERPATESLLDENLSGIAALDIGCGPGAYIDTLIKRGAQVTAFDASESMVQIAKQRHPSLNIFRYDLGYDMPRFRDGQFDLLLAALVFDYMEDWGRLFKELHRILKKDGICVFSSSHPTDDYAVHNLNDAKSRYFNVELRREEWKSYNVTLESYRRPLGNMFDAILGNGFSVERLLEPLPIEECRVKFPKEYELLSKHPGFICFKIMKK